MSTEIIAAIESLQAELAEEEHAFRKLERNVYGKRIAINRLCAIIGRPPPYPGADVDGVGSGAPPKPPAAAGPPGATTSLRPDSFYGKRQQTAIREFLEMRRLAGKGAASPREIFEALRDGGYQFEAKDENTALIGIRALLRKRTAFFHKLPNGAYGLTAWYPDAKKPKTAAAAPGDGEDHTEDDDVPHDDAQHVAKRHGAS